MNDARSFILRPARPEESAALTALAVRSKAYWGYDEEFMRASTAELMVTPEHVVAEPTYVAETNGRLAGFYMLEPLASGDFEVDFLFVEPGLIGRGCGKALFEHAMRTAAAAGARRVVIQSDPNAEAFYLRHGAKRIGARASASISGRELPLLEVRLVPRDR